MRLKRTLNRSTAQRVYYRWTISDLPRKLVETLGWKEGDKLSGEIRNGALLIHRHHEPRQTHEDE